MAGVAQKTVYKLRSQVDEKLARLPLKYFDSHPRGDILSRVTNDIDNIAQTLQQSLTQIITAVLTIIGVMIMMFTISPLLATVSLLTVPVSVVAAPCRSRSARRSSSRRSGSARASSTGTSKRCTRDTPSVKVFGRQKEAIEVFDAQNQELYELASGPSSSAASSCRR